MSEPPSPTKKLYNAFLVHFVRVRHFVMVIPHNVVVGRLRFLNLFSGLTSEFVFSGKSNSSMVSFTFTMSAMTWQPASVTSQSPKTNFLMSCSVKFSVVRLVSGVSDNFEHVVGASRSSPAEPLAGSPAGLPVALGWFLNVFLSPSSVDAS